MSGVAGRDRVSQGEVVIDSDQRIFGVFGRSHGIWAPVFVVGSWCWLMGFAWHFMRPGSAWLFDLVVVPGSVLGYWLGFTAVVVAAIVALARGERALPLVAWLLVVAALTALVNPFWRVAPRTWFATHRPLFEIARHVDPGTEYYGTTLPLPLRFLTESGRVSEVEGGIRFFPQWRGIPDDAGGFLYHPTDSPVGVDLYGRVCTEPVDLGGGWWMCGI